MKFQGFERPDGTVGVRNHLLVVAPINCAFEPAKRIASRVKGAVAITQPYGCLIDGNQQVVHNLAGIANNPNVAAVLLVGLGCETITVDLLAEEIAKSKKPVASVVCQREGGTLKTIRKGTRLLKEIAKEVKPLKRRPFDLSKLVVAVECGGSDATSGIAANPATGVAVDMLIDAGATVIFSEPLEMIGTEHILARRAVNDEVKEKVYRMIERQEKWMKAMGMDSRFMPKGNIDGGLTTIYEKALGAIRKGGTRPIQGVLENSRRILEKPIKRGLYLQDGTEFDVASLTHMIAAGAQIAVFTTGMGSTVGHAIAPVIKVTGNPTTYARMEENMDINAGTIIEGTESINSVGGRIFNLVLEVASGKKTKAEELGYRDFAIYRLDPLAERLLETM
jgi:altronate dehydratase large subunit